MPTVLDGIYNAPVTFPEILQYLAVHAPDDYAALVRLARLTYDRVRQDEPFWLPEDVA